MNHTNIATFPRFDASHNRVKEDSSVYIPDLLADDDYEVDSEVYSVATEYAKHLYEAKDLIGEARSLAGLVLAALEHETDERAAQIEAAVNIVAKKLKMANAQLDKHDTHHTNLFFAYVNSQGETKN